ncbi:MAG: hypothetical protein Q8L06_14450, partial [Pseudohongiella sp.]|nr:hypothetical protein [Pseudohongiella sp.]
KLIFFMMNKPSFSLWIILQDHDSGGDHALRHIIVLVSSSQQDLAGASLLYWTQQIFNLAQTYGNRQKP